MADEVEKQSVQAFAKYQQIIIDSVQIDKELSECKTIQTLRAALAKDKEDAAREFAFIDLGNTATVRTLQGRIHAAEYFESLLKGIDNRHKQAAHSVTEMMRNENHGNI